MRISEKQLSFGTFVLTLVIAVGAVPGPLFMWQRGIRSDIQTVRTEVQDMRADMQALSERVARIEGYMEGWFAASAPDPAKQP